MAHIRVLHLEDSRADSDLVRHLLDVEGITGTLERVQTRNEFTRALGATPWDLILADYSLPAFDGYAALNIAQKLAPHIPFIFVTGMMGEEVAVETLKRGATDYVLKQKMERLAPAVRRALKESTEKRLLHETQEALRDSEERFRLLIDGIRDYGVYMLRSDGMIGSWNAGATRIFGYAETEAVGMSAATLFLAQDRADRRCERLMRQAEQNGRVEQELWQVRRDGSSFWAEVNIAPIHAGKHLHGFAVMTQDVSERRRAKAQEEQDRDERARLQERFLSHVSHELRTPLTTVVDFTSIIAEGLAGEVTSDQKHYLEIVLHAANRLAVMVNSLLDLTRSDWHKLPITPECVMLENIVANACDSLTAAAGEKEITVRQSRPDAALPLVYADTSRITEVICNLLDNAIKYSPRGSTVSVACDICASDPEFVEVSVTDNGPGMAPEQAAHIFERFYRGDEASGDRPGGLGLGLYISREIVNGHGGELRVVTTPGAGSKFVFTVPRFALQRILLPLMSQRNLSKGLAALITVRLPEMPNFPAVDFGRYLASVRDVLKRLLYANDDLILPRVAIPGHEGCLHVLAFTREDGLPIILERVRENLAACIELQPLRGEFEASGILIDLSPFHVEEPQQVAREIAETVLLRIGLTTPSGEDDVRSKAKSVGC